MRKSCRIIKNKIGENVMKNTLLMRWLLVFCISTFSLLPLWGQYREVKVDAPFRMEVIKEFIYPQGVFL